MQPFENFPFIENVCIIFPFWRLLSRCLFTTSDRDKRIFYFCFICLSLISLLHPNQFNLFLLKDFFLSERLPSILWNPLQWSSEETTRKITFNYRRLVCVRLSRYSSKVLRLWIVPGLRLFTDNTGLFQDRLSRSSDFLSLPIFVPCRVVVSPPGTGVGCCL